MFSAVVWFLLVLGVLSQEEVRVTFTTAAIPDEYLVHFKHYLLPDARQRYIASALRDRFKIKERPRRDILASDFEVINFHGDLGPLWDHPEVKHVAPHRSVRRLFSVINSNETHTDSSTRAPTRSPIAEKRKKKPNIRSRNPPFLEIVSPKKPQTRHLLRAIDTKQVTYVLHAESLWQMGIRGAGVRVAVFDTGLADGHGHFQKIQERTDWTNEKTIKDGLGHGTFVAGVIASSHKACRGFAPDAELHVFRVFTNNQVSYTSWFLDAFNYAILKRINVLNLSIGGPDFMDRPFVDKVWELTANNIIMISAIGNDGPLYGTLNNPADQMDVIGVGGINFENEIARFSSRGMTTWELPAGYGRLKPDLVTYGSVVYSSAINGGCRQLSGTSVASPVVAGAVTLLLSGVLDISPLINPASMKQALLSSANRLSGPNMFEQGWGKLNLIEAYQALRAYTPQATLSPSYIDFTECPYMWPYCTQPLFYTAMPVIVNLTLLNGMGVTGRLVEPPVWKPYLLQNGDLLNISISHSEVFWPWSGYVALHIVVNERGASFEGVAEGYVSLTVESPPGAAEEKARLSHVKFPLKVKIIPTPPRQKRILWDQFHNLRYPSGYFPRDNLKMTNDPLDWQGDHMHTNFKELYTHLRNTGYYVDVLGEPFTCFDAKNYAVLLIVDPEEEFFNEEIVKLKADVERNNLNVVLFADWYNATVMTKIKFFDENTRQWWLPDTGGSNVPALNGLLASWNVSLGDAVLEGDFRLGKHEMNYASGTQIVAHPKEMLTISRKLNDQGSDVIAGEGNAQKKSRTAAIAGILQIMAGEAKAGRLSIYGDSNCLDSAHLNKECFWLLNALLQWSTTGQAPPVFDHERKARSVDEVENLVATEELPVRMKNNKLHKYSKVQGADGHEYLPTCRRLTFSKPDVLNSSAPGQVYKPQRLLSVDLHLIPPTVKIIEVVREEQMLPNGDVIQEMNHESSTTDRLIPSEWLWFTLKYSSALLAFYVLLRTFVRRVLPRFLFLGNPKTRLVTVA